MYKFYLDEEDDGTKWCGLYWDTDDGLCDYLYSCNYAGSTKEVNTVEEARLRCMAVLSWLNGGNKPDFIYVK